MNLIQRMEFWGDQHHPKWVDLIRIALGIFLMLKGAEFYSNSNSLIGMINNNIKFSYFMLVIVQHYVIFAHIFGGFLLAAGLLTRIACLIQIPILLGAMIFVNWQLLDYFSLFFLSLIILLLLLYFLVIGSGPWSLDRVLFGKNE